MARWGDDGRNSSLEFDWRHDPMRSSSLLNMAQTVGDEAFPRLTDPFHAQSGSGAVSKQALPTIAVVGIDGDARVDAEASEFANVWRTPLRKPLSVHILFCEFDVAVVRQLHDFANTEGTPQARRQRIFFFV